MPGWRRYKKEGYLFLKGREITLRKLVVATLLVFLMAPPLVMAGEIYKWTDDNGVTHFGAKAPVDKPSVEISEELKKASNIVEFREVKEIEYYRPSANEIPISVEVDVRLVDYTLSEESHALIQRQVKEIYRVYVELFGWPHQAIRPIVIKLFGNYQAFEAYQVANADGHVTSRSHYSPRRREVVMKGTEFTDATLGVLFHEVSHAIIHMGLRGTPTWINEGLAETFEYSQVKKGKISFGYNMAWVEIMQHKLQEGSLRPMSEYLAITNKQWRAESARVERSYYMIAWSMMMFMMTNDDAFKTLSAVINSGRQTPWWRGASLPERFSANYPGGLDKLDARWRKWLRTLPSKRGNKKR